MPFSRAASIVLFIALVLLTIDPAFLVLPFDDRAARREELRRRADPHPELASFLAGVRAHTRRGDTIALIVPMRDWDRYSAAYYRGSYLLAGRTVIPSLTKSGVAPGNVEAAEYVASWRVRYLRPNASVSVVWRGHGGTLMRQR